MKCYVDSSIVLRFLLSNDPAFEKTEKFDRIGSSELLIIECSRVLQRYRLEGFITDIQLAVLEEDLAEITSGMYILDITDSVKALARGSFPTIIGTLDAIHLASSVLWRESGQDESMMMLTADVQMSTCARAMGMQVLAL